MKNIPSTLRRFNKKKHYKIKKNHKSSRLAMRYHFYMFSLPSPPLNPLNTHPQDASSHTHEASYKWVKEKCVYLKTYDARVFLFLLHFLCYPRFSYRRYKTEKYISYIHNKITLNCYKIRPRIPSARPKKQSTHTWVVCSHTHGTAPFRKKIKCTHINCMQLERDALRVIKYSHRCETCRTHAHRASSWSHTHPHLYTNTLTHVIDWRKPCMCWRMLFLAATSREEFHSEYLAVKTARSLKFQILNKKPTKIIQNYENWKQ